MHCISEEQKELLQMLQKTKEKTKAGGQAASNECKSDAADLCFTVFAYKVVGYLVFSGQMFLKGMRMMMMESAQFCACIFLIFLCCVEEPFTAVALKPPKYGPIGEGNIMQTEGGDSGGAREQALGSNLGQGRVLLEAIINEVNVPKEIALKDEKDVEETKLQQHQVGASSSFDLLQKALGLKYGWMQQEKEKAQLEEEEQEEEEKTGNKVVQALNTTMTEKKNLKNGELELKAEENKLSISEAQEVVEEDEEGLIPVKMKVGHETELRLEGKRLSNFNAQEEVVDEQEEEESAPVKKKVANESELKAAAANKKKVLESEDQEAVEEEDEESIPVTKKGPNETVLKEEEDEESNPVTKKGPNETVLKEEEKELSKFEDQEAVEDREEAVPHVMKKLGKETELTEAADEKKLSGSELSLGALEEEENEEAIPQRKRVGKETNMLIAPDEKKLSESETQEVMDKEEVALPLKKKLGKQTNLTAADKELSESESQEAMDEEVEEAFSVKKKIGKETSLVASDKKELSASEVQETMEVQEAIFVKKKVGKETYLTVADKKELSEAEAQKAVEEEDEETFPVEKKVGKNKIEPNAAEEKALSIFETQEAVKEEEEESIFVMKKMGNKVGLKETEEKKLSKSDSQEAVEEEEDEDKESIFVKQKQGTKTGLKAKEEKVLPESEAQETVEESILAKKKPGSITELKAADEKELSKTEAQNLVEAEEEEESVPVQKKEGMETDLKATEDKNLFKYEPQDAVEEDEEESIPVKKKVEKETDLKAMKDKELSKPEAQEAAEEEEEEKNKEETKGDNKSLEGMRMNNSQAAAEEADPALDLDPVEIDLLQEVQDLPANLQQTVGAVTTHLLPKIQQISGQSKDSFDKINKNLASSFLPLIGEKYALVIATIVSYCLLMLPFGVVLFLCERMRSILTLQKVLLFINIYLAVYFSIFFALALGLGAEPISFFYKNSMSGYIILQLLQAFGYIIYMLLQTADILFTCSTGTLLGKWSAAMQCLLATMVGLHYYVTVFHRAMARKAPHTSWKYYGLYCLSFFVCCLLSRVQRGKREYIPLGNETTDKWK